MCRQAVRHCIEASQCERRVHSAAPNVDLITSMQWAPDIHYGMTTVNDIMNIGRAINVGEITFYTDGTFGMCKNEVCLIGVWVGKRCDGTAIVGYSVNPSESEDGMRATYEGLQKCFFWVFKRFAPMWELEM